MSFISVENVPSSMLTIAIFPLLVNNIWTLGKINGLDAVEMMMRTRKPNIQRIIPTLITIIICNCKCKTMSKISLLTFMFDIISLSTFFCITILQYCVSYWTKKNNTLHTYHMMKLDIMSIILVQNLRMYARDIYGRCFKFIQIFVKWN